MLQTIVVLILATIILSSLGGGAYLFSTQDLGYSSGFQNPKAQFVGVKYNDKKYTSTSHEGASQASFDTTLRFDADKDVWGKPNVIGEMTTVFVPKESLSGAISWIPTEFLKRTDAIHNPEQTYSWNISGKTYKMEQWVLKYYISFSGEWDGDESLWRAIPILGTRQRNYYSNLEIWIEFDLTPTWYIEGGGTAYFAIGKIQVSDVKKYAKDNNDHELTAETELSFLPESEGASLYVYYGLWGVGGAESEAYKYQGKALNPALFTNKVYAKLTLNNFGVTNWYDFPVVKTKGDAIVLGFSVTAFIIGEWDVKDIQNIPEDFGRTTKTTMPPSLMDYLSDPRIQALLTLLAMAGFFLIIMLVAPGVLIAIVAIFMGGRKRK